MTTDNGLPADPATPPDADPAVTPAAPQVKEDDRLSRLETTVETLANAITQGMSRTTPPTPDDSQAIAEAKRLQEQLAEEAKTNPAVQTALTIGQGLYNHMQAENAKLQARLDLAEIDDAEEKKLTKAAWESGDFRTVEAARRAVKGDLVGNNPAPAKPDPEKVREQVEQARTKPDANVRGVSAPDFKKRMTDDQYVSKVGDVSLPMEERIKLRHERAGIVKK